MRFFFYSSHRRLEISWYDDVGKDDVDFITCKKNNKHKWESEFVARMPFRSDYLEESEGGLYGRKYYLYLIAGSYCNNQGYVCGVLEESLLA